MEDKNYVLLIFKSIVKILVFLHCIQHNVASPDDSPKERRGTWQLLMNNTGVVAMHMVLTRYNTVIMFDQSGSDGFRRIQQTGHGAKCEETNYHSKDQSCLAHSVEYNILSNTIRPLNLQTDVLSSSGSILSNGEIIQTGGHGNGSQRIHYFESCEDSKCDWRQSNSVLFDERWFSSNLLIPEDDRVIVVGGKKVFSYEFVPAFPDNAKAIKLPFLHQTYDKNGGNNLYPFLHLSSDGNLFIFANRNSILFDYKQNKVVKTYPQIPGTGSRTYPSSGSSVLLPLDYRDGFQKVEVMVCGGAAPGAYEASSDDGRFLTGMKSCGRLVITGDKNRWNMENMPGPRLMNDMVILPTGHVLIINGAKSGCAGLGSANSPVLQPYLYNPHKKLGKRFSVLKSAEIPRMYSSSAILLPDGRVLVAGSNPNERYAYRHVRFPTELRLQAYIPRHMGQEFDHIRPQNVSIYYSNGSQDIPHGEEFSVNFWLKREQEELVFHAYSPPFTTHSISMNQRMLRLKCNNLTRTYDGWLTALLQAPPSPNIAPAGYYLLTVVHGGIPSISQWIRFNSQSQLFEQDR